MDQIHLRLLGGFQLILADASPVALTARKAQALVACLALSPGRACSRDKLLALLWEDSPPARARGSLRNLLTGLRRVLPRGLLKSTGEQLVLAGEGLTVDVTTFETLAASAEPGHWQRAVDLYQGELLEGFDCRSAAFDDWLMIRRSHLRERAIATMTALLEHHLAQRTHDPAVRLALGLLALDPLQEPVHRCLMTLYARQRRFNAAFHQYRTCQTLLRRELAIAPEPETEALYRDILRQRRDSKPAAAPAEPREGMAAACLAAARRDRQEGRHEQALQWVQQGLMLEADPALEFELTCLHGELLEARGDGELALEEFQHAAALAVEIEQGSSGRERHRLPPGQA